MLYSLKIEICVLQNYLTEYNDNVSDNRNTELLISINTEIFKRTLKYDNILNSLVKVLYIFSSKLLWNIAIYDNNRYSKAIYLHVIITRLGLKNKYFHFFLNTPDFTAYLEMKDRIDNLSLKAQDIINKEYFMFQEESGLPIVKMNVDKLLITEKHIEFIKYASKYRINYNYKRTDYFYLISTILIKIRNLEKIIPDN